MPLEVSTQSAIPIGTMFDEGPLDLDHEERPVSTGLLPSEDEVSAVVVEAYQRYRGLTDGVIADYIPALAKASATQFGVCLVGVRGRSVAVGDADHLFSIQSISKLFTFALVCEFIGYREARDRLGVNSTGLPFNSVMAIELNADRTINPMVNAGAIATTSLVPGDSGEEKFAAHRRRAEPFRRPPAGGRRGGLRIRGGDELPQPWHRTSHRQLRTHVLRSRCRHRHLHPPVLASP